MRRFLTLFCLLLLAIPAGISISGCTRNPGAGYCNGLGYGEKITDVAAITLQPATTGISIAFGQTSQASQPTMVTCKGTSATGTITWGTTDRQLVDISPTGSICAGSWNRNSGGGIPNYTICTPPSSPPSTGGLPYATAFITASAQTVVSNPVEVFVHAQVTSVNLVTQATSLGGSGQQCYSQGTQATLDAEACFAQNNTQYELCAPPSVSSTSQYTCPGKLPPGASSVLDCTATIGTLSYSVATPNIAALATNTTTNQVTITANQPGTTIITASVAGSGSSAGYFSTCPPKSISVTLANGETQGTITQGVTQNLVTTVYDTNVTQCPPTSTNPTGGCPLTGLLLDYQSTDPIDISANTTGSITTSFPGVASVYAICQPTTCNPSPINKIGLFGTGLPVASNPVVITTPGTASDYVWFGAPGQSQYIVPIELLTGAVGSTVRLPYVPNSMIMDRLGNNLYFGSGHGLISVSASTGAVGKLDSTVPGVVLAVSPNNTNLLINDQVRQLFYIYSASAGVSSTFGGMGNAAAWTPDSKTLYITDSASLNSTPDSPEQGITGHSDTLYVYNANTGWTTYPLPPSPLTNPLPPGLPPSDLPPNPMPPNVAISSTNQTPALTIPSVGAYLRGSPTTAHTWCPTGTAANYNSMIFYPQSISDSVDVQTDTLAATTDGQHILGAAVTGSGFTLSDIANNIPTVESPSEILTPISCPETTDPATGIETLSALSVGPTLNETLTIDPTRTNATAVNQVVASPESNLAFITYTGSTTGAELPYYVPGSGAVNYVTLTGNSAITAPLAGAFTPDDKLFFVSTAGDNMIHYISIPTAVTPATPPVDTQQISPNLPACTPGIDAGCLLIAPTTNPVPATAIAVKPRSTT
ncbi:MAG: hypothetical protein ABR905_05205 [Terracidiphilus sp.]|jgi:sugar lactone lactonase YvrE